MQPELVAIAHEFSPLRANLLRTRLEAEGIECFLSGETLTSVVGSLSYAAASWSHPEGNITLRVRADDEALAREVLNSQEWDSQDDSVGEGWDEADVAGEPLFEDAAASEYNHHPALDRIVLFLLKLGLASAVAVGVGLVAEYFFGWGQAAAFLVLLILCVLILKSLFKVD